MKNWFPSKQCTGTCMSLDTGQLYGRLCCLNTIHPGLHYCHWCSQENLAFQARLAASAGESKGGNVCARTQRQNFAGFTMPAACKQVTWSDITSPRELSQKEIFHTPAMPAGQPRPTSHHVKRIDCFLPGADLPQCPENHPHEADHEPTRQPISVFQKAVAAATQSPPDQSPEAHSWGSSWHQQKWRPAQKPAIWTSGWQ